MITIKELLGCRVIHRTSINTYAVRTNPQKPTALGFKNSQTLRVPDKAQFNLEPKQHTSIKLSPKRVRTKLLLDEKNK